MSIVNRKIIFSFDWSTHGRNLRSTNKNRSVEGGTGARIAASEAGNPPAAALEVTGQL
jgi:hypothetical protein